MDKCRVLFSMTLLCLPSLAFAGGEDRVSPNIKVVASQAKTVASYFSSAKGVYDTAITLGKVLGLIDTDDTSARLKAIESQLDSLATGLSWEISQGYIDGWRIGHAIPAILSVQRNGTATDNSADDQDSRDAAGGLLSDVAFYRPYNEKITDGGWKEIVKYTKDELLPHAGGTTVWDWRLGMPALLEAISYRIQVIAAIDPNFRNDHRYDAEFEFYRAGLKSDLDKMVAGVKCRYDDDPPHRSLPLGTWCADIRTGLFASRGFTDERGQSLDEIFSDLRGQVFRQMPVFETRSMIDTLYFYQHGESDLTEAFGRIPLAHSATLCLDVQWAGRENATPVWLWSCNRTDAQRWSYDRKSGAIVNPPSGKCLDVQYANSTIGTPVWLWECNGTDAQRWTYDYEHGVLENALGTVLDVQWDQRRQETPVWTWDRNETEAQQWRADLNLLPCPACVQP